MNNDRTPPTRYVDSRNNIRRLGPSSPHLHHRKRNTFASVELITCVRDTAYQRYDVRSVRVILRTAYATARSQPRSGISNHNNNNNNNTTLPRESRCRFAIVLDAFSFTVSRWIFTPDIVIPLTRHRVPRANFHEEQTPSNRIVGSIFVISGIDDDKLISRSLITICRHCLPAANPPRKWFAPYASLIRSPE